MFFRHEMQKLMPRSLIARIRESVIGDGTVLEGPFGPRRARLRRLHRLRSVAGLHRGLHPRAGAAALREHAYRGLGHRTPDDARCARTRARIIHARGQRRRRGRRALLRLRRDRRDRQARRGARPAAARALPDSPPPARQRPVVFVGPYEHHSNELPWRESIADVVDDPRGRRRAASTSSTSSTSSAATPTGRCKIGSFSAASNVTGIVTDVDAVSIAAAPPRRARAAGTTPPPGRTCRST